MHNAHFLCYRVSLRVAQTHSRHPPHTRSPNSHTLQELKDDRLVSRYSMASYAVV